jgi:hypothetical protein
MTSIGLFRRVVTANSYLFEVIAVPINYSSACTFTSDEDFEVEWGDGTFISYSAGSASVVPTGTINIRSANAVTLCRFNTDTYNKINITQGSTLTSARLLCYNLRNLTEFNINDASNIVDFSNAWRNCYVLSSFPLIDTSSGVDFSNAWRGCYVLSSFPLIDTSSGVDFSNAWDSCIILSSFPLIDTSSGTIFTSAWSYISASTGMATFPGIDLSSAINLSFAFYGSRIISFPTLSYPLVTNLNAAWASMEGETFGNLSAPNATNLSLAFLGSALIEIGDVSISGSANVDRIFGDADVLRCIKSITTTSTMTNKSRMLERTGVLKYPNPDDVVELISSSGDVYNNPSPTDCAAFAHNGVLTSAKGINGNTYDLDYDRDLPATSSLAPECIIKFGHNDVTIDASTGWTNNGNNYYSIQVATHVKLQAFDYDRWYYQLVGTHFESFEEIAEGLGIFTNDYQSVSIEWV